MYLREITKSVLVGGLEPWAA